MSLSQLFDPYSLRARLQPALITLSPLAFGIIAWAGPSKPWMSSLYTLSGTIGLTFMLANIVRNRGKKVEENLWREWGGAPTTQLLRHAGSANPLMRDRWHKNLAKISGVAFPTSAEERQDPARADAVYEDAVRLAINKTRDTSKYPLVNKENVQYGFCRNLYGMRPAGIVAALVGLGVSISAICHFSAAGTATIIPWVCAGLCTVVLLAWLLAITADSVKIPAFAYSNRLLETTNPSARPRGGKNDTPTS